MNLDTRLLWFNGLLFPVVVWSGVRPHDYPTWWLEASPVLLGIGLILWFQKRFPLSTLLLAGIWLHFVILLVGAHYTYAEVPLFDWIADQAGTTRNNYDKVGHFAQGFVPAFLAREILLRCSPLGDVGKGRPSAWLPFLVTCVCLAFSAFYELIKWAVALVAGDGSDAFLGTQGYVWDTQSDMGFALIGAIVALTFFRGAHDSSLAKITAA